ncbi:MAG: ester cyclase [Hyphomicrobiaceae bacterium]
MNSQSAGKGAAAGPGWRPRLLRSPHQQHSNRHHGGHAPLVRGDFCVQEHQWSGTVPGSLLGVPGRGKHISFRLLHIWAFRDGKISRDNVWLDSVSIVAQLTAGIGD